MVLDRDRTECEHGRKVDAPFWAQLQEFGSGWWSRSRQNSTFWIKTCHEYVDVVKWLTYSTSRLHVLTSASGSLMSKV